jgi:hypothetical protein
MLYLMFLAHLLGDYLFQSDGIARWKARSLAGVLAHGAIVVLTTLMCAALVSPAWCLSAYSVSPVSPPLSGLGQRCIAPHGRRVPAPPVSGG